MNTNNKEKLEQLLKRLSIVLKNQNFSKLISTNEDFARIINNEIIAAKKISSATKSAKKEIEEIIKKFNEISTSKFDDKAITFNEVADAIDYANYLTIYCKNILKVDLDKLSENTEIKIDKLNNTSNNNFNSSNNAYQNMGFGIGFNSNATNITIPNPMLQKQAWENVRKRLTTDNSISIYKTNPKHIFCCKWVFSIAMVLYSLFLIVASILLIIISNRTAVITQGTTTFGTLISGIFGICFSILFFFIGWGINIKSYIAYLKNNTKISNNEKLQVSTWSVGLTIFFAIVYLFFVIWPSSTVSSNVFNFTAILPNNSNIYGCVIAIESCVGICIAMAGLLSIFGVILCATHPKEDPAVLQSLFNEEFAKLTNQDVHTPPATPVDLTNKEIKQEDNTSKKAKDDDSSKSKSDKVIN